MVGNGIRDLPAEPLHGRVIEIEGRARADGHGESREVSRMILATLSTPLTTRPQVICRAERVILRPGAARLLAVSRVRVLTTASGVARRHTPLGNQTKARQSPYMDPRMYSQLSDSIASASSPDEIAAMRELMRTTELHPLERQALERVLRSRADALRLVGDAVVYRAPAERAD